jgi:hypothetical protein
VQSERTEGVIEQCRARRPISPRPSWLAAIQYPSELCSWRRSMACIPTPPTTHPPSQIAVSNPFPAANRSSTVAM